MKIIAFAKQFLKDESGPTAVEYAIMLALILAALIATITIVGTETNLFFEDVGDKMETINSGGTI